MTVYLSRTTANALSQMKQCDIAGSIKPEMLPGAAHAHIRAEAPLLDEYRILNDDLQNVAQFVKENSIFKTH